MKKIYIASPLGFSEAGREFYYKKRIPLLIYNGFEVINPWELTPKNEIEKIQNMDYGKEKKLAWQNQNMIIAENNRVGIDDCDFMLAVLDGTDVDSGTASEIGYAFAKEKKVVGYRGDFRLSSDNEGGMVNLQVEYFIRKSHGTIVTNASEILSELNKF